MAPEDSSDDESPFQEVPSDPADDAPSERAGRLDEKEKRLDSRERELEQRAQKLDEREQEVLNRREETVELREEIEDKEAELAEREAQIEDRETALQERERELQDRANELDRKEATLKEYVGDQIENAGSVDAETIRDAVDSALEGRDFGGGSSRFGAIGGLLLGLVGMVLVVAGVANGFATEIDSIPTLFSSSAGNFGASAVLIFSGLAANLAAAAGRV